jgi:hypothetical protein
VNRTFLLRFGVSEKFVVCDNIAKILRWPDGIIGTGGPLGVKIQMMSLRGFPEVLSMDSSKLSVERC